MINPENGQNAFIQALRAGDRAAFAQLVEEYSEPIYRLALKMVSDPQDAEDILQDTFIKAFNAASSFEGRSSLSTWLYRIAVNESLMHFRRRKGVPVSIEDHDDDENSEPMQVVDWCCLPEQELLSGEASRFLDEAVKRLPEKLRTVFILRDIEGLSVRDTAETLNITEESVKTRLLRARLKLREHLTGYYAERIAERK